MYDIVLRAVVLLCLHHVCVWDGGTLRRKNQKAGPVGPGFGETLCGPGQPRAFLAELASHISFSVSTIPELSGEIVTHRGHSAHWYILILSKSVGLLHQLAQALVL